MRRRRRRHVWPLLAGTILVVAGAVAAALLLTRSKSSPPVAGPAASSASFAHGFAQLSQTNALAGRLVVSRTHRLGSEPSAYAEYLGNGRNGYARGIFNVDWRPGANVAYSADFYLPSGFHAAIQGQVALMRWDNFPSRGAAGADQGGVVINSDRLAFLERDGIGGSGTREQQEFLGPFPVPEGRWFALQVRQRLSAGSGARSEVLLDGRRVAAGNAPNMFGRPIQRIRYGIVAIAAGRQRDPLRLWFTRPTAAPGAVR